MRFRGKKSDKQLNLVKRPSRKTPSYCQDPSPWSGARLPRGATPRGRGGRHSQGMIRRWVSDVGISDLSKIVISLLRREAVSHFDWNRFIVSVG